MACVAAAEKIAAEFEFGPEEVRRGVKHFVKQMDEGLGKLGTTMSQIPTYVTAVPDGSEKGLYMAVDLGGTNFRVCSIQLHGNSTFSLTQSKTAIPRELMVAETAEELFAFLAKQIETFFINHHEQHYDNHIVRVKSGGGTETDLFDLGFTFSFPVEQIGINKGNLIRWTKGFDIKDAIGRDVCGLLQSEINKLQLPIKVAALVNDTVGTLMARAYTSEGRTGTLLGSIFGTGTNGAYVEKLDRITKLKDLIAKGGDDSFDKSTGEMIVNTEWGSFDNELSVLPITSYDRDLDAESVNPGIQMFEKRISGMFLGELLRRAVVRLLKDPEASFFSDESSAHNDFATTTNLSPDSGFHKRWGVDTSLLSIAHADSGDGLQMTRQTLRRDYGVHGSSVDDAKAIKIIASAIGRRAARLSAVAVAAVILSSGRLESTSDPIDMGADGSVVEFYPDFEKYIREALREVPEIGEEGEKRFTMGIAKDGSGVGAALIALVAGKSENSS